MNRIFLVALIIATLALVFINGTYTGFLTSRAPGLVSGAPGISRVIGSSIVWPGGSVDVDVLAGVAGTEKSFGSQETPPSQFQVTSQGSFRPILGSLKF